MGICVSLLGSGSESVCLFPTPGSVLEDDYLWFCRLIVTAHVWLNISVVMRSCCRSSPEIHHGDSDVLLLQGRSFGFWFLLSRIYFSWFVEIFCPPDVPVLNSPFFLMWSVENDPDVPEVISIYWLLHYVESLNCVLFLVSCLSCLSSLRASWFRRWRSWWSGSVCLGLRVRIVLFSLMNHFSLFYDVFFYILFKL